MPDQDVVGVLGAGQIGRSVAHAFAERSPVILVDLSDAVAAEAVAAIRRAHLGRLLRGATAVALDTLLRNVRTAGTVSALCDAALVVENITESPEEKLAVHHALAEHLHPDTPVAANTSAVPLSYLATAHGATAGRLLGLHFMMPVVEIRWLELITGDRTAATVVDRTTALLARHGFTPIPVRDSPGFIANRLLMLLINEAAAMVREGVADAAAVDTVLQRCLGHRMGPLATADLIGLDTVVRSLKVLQRFADPVKFAPDTRLTELVAAGRLGRKSGGGFFDYLAGTGEPTRWTETP